MSTPAPEPTKVEETKPIDPAVTPTTPEAKPITAAALVDADKDEFPAGSGSSPMPGLTGDANPPPSQGSNPEAVKRGRGRPPGSKSKPKTPEANAKPDFSDVDGTPTTPKAEVKPINYDAMAKMVFGMSAGTLANVFGPEWLPRPPQPGQPGEEEMMIGAIAAYMRASEMPDIPPGIMLVLVCGMYAAPRFAAPNTKEKVKGMWMWIKSKFARKKKHIVIQTQDTRQTEAPKEEKKVDPLNVNRDPDEWDDN